MKTIPDDILELILDLYLEHISDTDKKRLELWVMESSEHKEFFRQIISSSHRIYLSCHDKDAQKVRENLYENISRSRKKLKRRMLICYSSCVAMVILLLGIGIMYINQDLTGHIESDNQLYAEHGARMAILKLSTGAETLLGKNTGRNYELGDGMALLQDTIRCVEKKKNSPSISEKLTTIIVPLGGEYNLTLSDGTNVWLNSGSELKFPASFSEKKREVMLKGEAYFEVASNINKPFIIKTLEANISVLGTSFNIMNYADENKAEVALKSGRVVFHSNLTEEECSLEPGDVVRLNKINNDIIKTKEDVERIAAWRTGYFYFENMPMEDLVVKLERWYQVKFIFASDEVKHMRFTGAVKKYNNLSYILDIITKTQDILFIDKDGAIKICKK